MPPRISQITAHDILNQDEINLVLADLKAKGKRSQRAIINLGVFRALLCGLRASEAAGLRIEDVCLSSSRPHLFIRAENTKGVRGKDGKTTRKARQAYIFSSSALEDLRMVLEQRKATGAKASDPFLVSTTKGSVGNGLTRFQIRKRFVVCCGCLERKVTAHTGRHTFASMMLGLGKSPAVVAAAGGWTNQSVLLSTYSHIWDDASSGSWMVE